MRSIRFFWVQDEFTVTGIPGETFASVDKALDERTIGHNPERLNMMKGGIIYSNMVTTVSPTYADETLNGGAAGRQEELGLVRVGSQPALAGEKRVPTPNPCLQGGSGGRSAGQRYGASTGGS